MKPKIVFFGSDRYSQIVFKALKTDRRFETAKAPPAKVKTKEIARQIRKFKPKVGILASYGKILTSEVLNLFPFGVLNLHPSLLPKYRGPTPVPSALLAGETETGLTILKMDKEVDHGPMVAQFKVPIKSTDTSEVLLNRCFAAGAKILLTILPAYLENRITPRPQSHQKATFTPKFTRESGLINWQKPAAYNERFIRAMFPWPGAWTKVKIGSALKRLKILQGHLEKGELILDLVQLEGKKPVVFKQFQEGYPKAKIISSF